MKNDIQLFNIYMKVLLENKAPLTPSEIAAEIEARQLIPNRVGTRAGGATYLMFGLHHETRETCLQDLRPGQTQTKLLSHIRSLRFQIKEVKKLY